MDAGRFNPLVRNLAARLRDPLQLRFISGLAILVAWYVAVYSPLSQGIEAAQKQRSAAVEHAALAKNIEALRREAARVKPRLPAATDPNEWVEYLLAGLRDQPLRLLKLEPQGIKKHGPFSLVVLRLELSGAFADVSKLLAWIESNPRLFRIDVLSLEPNKGAEHGVTLRLTVLGVMG